MNRSNRRALCIAALLAGLTVMPGTRHADALEKDGARLPPTLRAGGQSLHLTGCGTREALLSDVYVVALYLPETGMPRERILAPETAKAVRLRVVYDGSMPQDIPESWNEPLRDMVDHDLRQTFRELYRRFRSGDRLTITYAPQSGTEIALNGQTLRRAADDRLIRPLLRLWIGREAVSDNLRRLLLQGRCETGDDGWF